MKKVLRDKQQGLPLVSENANFGQFLVKWLEEEIKPKREYNTYRSYAQQVYPHILPWLGHISFNKFTADILNVYLTEKLAELQEKLSPKAESKRRGART